MEQGRPPSTCNFQFLIKRIGLSAVLLYAPYLHAQVIANPDTGVADANVGSIAIAKVTANDTVNGAAATLGSTGNSVVSKVGAWPPGLTLVLSTGAVTTGASLSAGVYSVNYMLCDKSSPPNCSTTSATVTVQLASVVPVADSGTANAGTASTPIANVAANDTINGAAATLGTSGNAYISKDGTWPSGISLNITSGAITVTPAVAAGVYNLQYFLCDRNSPPVCLPATDTVTLLASSIVIMTDSGTTRAGTLSTPIGNVAANDTVNGAPATLGPSGNATVSKVGTWANGISLDTSTGGIVIGAGVPPAVYSLGYRLCDKKNPPDCATTTDSVVVLTASVVPVPDSGTAAAGVASTPIPNVAANDTINNVHATLGSAGNASIAQVGVWPSGIALNLSTGAVTATAVVPAAIYSVMYQLCDVHTPVRCVSTTDTVTLTGAIVPTADTGTAILGQPSTPVANVAANDLVNGTQATLGASGNATVAQVGSWPTGISLNPTSGAITTLASVAMAPYYLQYQLCDLSIPPNCATATDTILVTPAFTEIQAAPDDFGDIEFDWGRDGLYCATCNFGQGNARFNWPDSNGNLWVGHLDPTTGAFTPPSGMNELVDNLDQYVLNGPEWSFSTVNGQVNSQLVYTRTTPGQPATTANAGVAFATQSASGWTASFLPGAGPGAGATINTIDPEGSQCNTDSIALSIFNDTSNPSNVYVEPLTTAPGTAPQITPFGSYYSAISGGKPSPRFVPCTHQLVFIGSAPPDANGNVYQQVYWYDTDSGLVQQLTTDANQHAEAFMFQAPEFQDAFVFYTITNSNELDIYKQSGVDGNNAPIFQLVNQIRSTDPLEPYMSSTEPFVHCSPVCQSYIFMKLSQVPLSPLNRNVYAIGLGVTNIDPAQPQFKVIIPYWATPTYQRTDLEYYITTNGPYLYYGLETITTPMGGPTIFGRYFVDMQLGPPSGPCVGSSAEDGLLPGC